MTEQQAATVARINRVLSTMENPFSDEALGQRTPEAIAQDDRQAADFGQESALLTFHNGTFDAPRYSVAGVAAPWSDLSVFELDEIEMDLRDMEADFANEMRFVRSKIAKRRNEIEVAPDVDCSGSWL